MLHRTASWSLFTDVVLNVDHQHQRSPVSRMVKIDLPKTKEGNVYGPDHDSPLYRHFTERRNWVKLRQI
jgi:hypothetical protein